MARTTRHLSMAARLVAAAALALVALNLVLSVSRAAQMSPVSLARRDVEFGLAFTLDWFDTRAAQDRWALVSHQRAAQGTADGRLTAEIAPWRPSTIGR